MTARPIVRGEGEGEKRWFLGGGIHTWKATSEDTGGAFILFEDTLEQGKMTPLHRHPRETEMVYVIEGEILVYVDGAERRIGAGSTVVTPAGVPHAFTVTSAVARLLFLQTPGSGEAFYRNASQPLAESPGPVDFPRLGQVAVETGATVIMGPPPFKKG